MHRIEGKQHFHKISFQPFWGGGAPGDMDEGGDGGETPGPRKSGRVWGRGRPGRRPRGSGGYGWGRSGQPAPPRPPPRRRNPPPVPPRGVSCRRNPYLLKNEQYY